MTWRECRLGDVITLKRGHDLPEHLRQDGDVPVVSSSGVTGYHKEAKASPPGVVTGRYGTLGEVFYIEENYWPLNTALYVIDFKGNDPRFAAYSLKNALRGYRSDKAAVPGIDRNVLHELTVKVPGKNEQVAIRSTLSAYDDLIANNRRRIGLLEQSTRLLFNEWFVHLRYPGHEHDNIENGVPAGWKRQQLSEVLTLHYGKALTEEKREPGDVYVYGSSGNVGRHNVKLVDGPGIVVGRKGNVGSVFWVDESFWPIDTVYYDGSSENVSLFVLHLLQAQTFQNSDAAVPGLNRDYAYRTRILWPKQTLRDEFEEFAKPIFAQRRTLLVAISKLEAARDLLLPRLMDGRISV